jgi:hypothetical protein
MCFLSQKTFYDTGDENKNVIESTSLNTFYSILIKKRHK